MKTVVIAGASGFAGAGLTKRCLDAGYEVLGIDCIAFMEADKLPDSVKNHPNFTYLWKGLDDVKPWDIPDEAIIIDLAAYADVPFGLSSPKECIRNNIMSTVSLLDAVKEVNIDRFIFASSGNVFGRPLYIPIDENHPLVPHNPYSASKCCQELVCWAWHRAYDIPLVVMSNGIVCGPGMRRDIVIYRWLYNILKGRPIIIEGEPIADQTRDITFVSDVLDAWMLTIKAPRDVVIGQKFQVSYGEEMRVEEIAKLCMDVCNKTVPVIRKPHRPGEKGQRECFDTTKAKTMLGYNPKIAPREAIALTVPWVKKQIDLESRYAD